MAETIGKWLWAIIWTTVLIAVVLMAILLSPLLIFSEEEY